MCPTTSPKVRRKMYNCRQRGTTSPKNENGETYFTTVLWHKVYFFKHFPLQKFLQLELSLFGYSTACTRIETCHNERYREYVWNFHDRRKELFICQTWFLCVFQRRFGAPLQRWSEKCFDIGSVKCRVLLYLLYRVGTQANIWISTVSFIVGAIILWHRTYGFG